MGHTFVLFGVPAGVTEAELLRSFPLECVVALAPKVGAWRWFQAFSESEEDGVEVVEALAEAFGRVGVVAQSDLGDFGRVAFCFDGSDEQAKLVESSTWLYGEGHGPNEEFADSDHTFSLFFAALDQDPAVECALVDAADSACSFAERGILVGGEPEGVEIDDSLGYLVSFSEVSELDDWVNEEE